MSKAALEKLALAVEQLQAQVATLTERLAKLETPAVPLPEAQTAPAEQEIEPEILLAISAAVAAYLGERAHVRAVRLVRYIAVVAGGPGLDPGLAPPVQRLIS